VVKVIDDHSHANYSSIGFLKALTALRLVLESMRLRWELRVGFVALRGLGKIVMLLIILQTFIIWDLSKR
jgi:hypothetical protein